MRRGHRLSIRFSKRALREHLLHVHDYFASPFSRYKRLRAIHSALQTTSRSEARPPV